VRKPNHRLNSVQAATTPKTAAPRRSADSACAVRAEAPYRSISSGRASYTHVYNSIVASSKLLSCRPRATTQGGGLFDPASRDIMRRRQRTDNGP
jgi:hypothetical protein